MFRTKNLNPDLLEQAIIQALSAPKWLESVHIGPRGAITLIIHADPENLSEAESRRLEAESRVRSVADVTSVNAVLTAERNQPPQAKLGGKASDKTRYTLIDRR